MRLQPRARAGIALLAAYAVALQALLLTAIASSAALAGTAVVPICASTHHSAPADSGQADHGQDCLDACLTGCCCAAPLLPAPARALRYAPKPLLTLATAFEAQAPIPAGRGTAHRSRAPPAA
ncbi:MAG TPA: DUF2946 family protein [Xanthobacteraceae bacterium]|jgi:hypothetical protein|nr:DUF2946 family protein [Xanthobacteraceae bacterium]